MVKRFFNWLNKLEVDRTLRENKVKIFIKNFFNAKTPEELWEASIPIKTSTEMHKPIFTEDAQDYIPKSAIENMDKAKTHTKAMKIIYNFFGMNRDWKLGRNLLGGFLVHSPEYPTYFIPAYTQTKATGDADDLKKGEGPRGLLTGALEGVAVGALVSGKTLKPGEMIPYMLLGAGLQFLSSKFFPWLAEKVGKRVYNKRLHMFGQNPVQKINEAENTVKPPTPKFSGMYNYGFNPKGNLKI